MGVCAGGGGGGEGSSPAGCLSPPLTSRLEEVPCVPSAPHASPAQPNPIIACAYTQNGKETGFRMVSGLNPLFSYSLGLNLRANSMWGPRSHFPRSSPPFPPEIQRPQWCISSFWVRGRGIQSAFRAPSQHPRSDFLSPRIYFLLESIFQILFSLKDDSSHKQTLHNSEGVRA